MVVLPIYACGEAHQVEGAGFKPDDSKSLVHHYFKGRWKQDHLNIVDASEVYGTQHEGTPDISGRRGAEQDGEGFIVVEEKVVEVKTEVSLLRSMIFFREYGSVLRAQA